ncbi:MAG TPA: heterodisulfide reductase-related iron-sulfur binding cluster, partial [Burkholderiales bacterium]|nr:heterodisulfide reductase-related iron-sulfur binding cluster [Burkholderiales bacterium]
VLRAAGHRVYAPPGLCCGRTYYSVGMIGEARRRAGHMRDALAPYVARGIPVVGLEPSCLFSLRDEFPALLPGTQPLAASALLFEEFLAREPRRLKLSERRKEFFLHGHCHQKAFDAMPAVEAVLGMIPGAKLTRIASGCCGMAGSFGYEAEHYETSMKMGEAGLLPAVREAPADAVIVADGTSCRHQIADATGRRALHVARVLEGALP